MKFSVVMPSYLAPYAGAASNREGKLIRAVNSVISQSFPDWELHVVADGCKQTMEIMEQFTDERVKTWYINHKKLWSGAPRNKGIEEAKGEWIIYLDIDDLYGDDHLKKVAEGLGNYNWVWYNDIRWHPRFKVWFDNPCNIKVLSQHGTSNICHKVRMLWDEEGRYAHDFFFVKKLRQNPNYTKISTPEYYVAHLPGRGGYDL